MTLVKDFRKTVTDTNPVFVAVGVTDLAVERLREARARGAAVRHDFTPSALQDRPSSASRRSPSRSSRSRPMCAARASRRPRRLSRPTLTLPCVVTSWSRACATRSPPRTCSPRQAAPSPSARVPSRPSARRPPDRALSQGHADHRSPRGRGRPGRPRLLDPP